MKKGKHLSKETRKKISESNKGKIVSIETRRKISEANKGKPSPMLGKHHSKESKRKLSESHSGKNNHFFGKKHTPESLKKIGEASKGRKFSLESLKKMSKSRTGKKRSLETRKRMSEAQKGEKAPWFGKHLSVEHKRNLSKALKGKKNPFYGKHHPPEILKILSEAKKGEKHPFWLGGKSFEPYGYAFNKDLKELIRARDGHRCQECFKHETELFSKNGKPKKLSIHHINYSKTHNCVENLISLCPNCHSKTNFKRKDWTKYFQKKIILAQQKALKKLLYKDIQERIKKQNTIVTVIGKTHAGMSETSMRIADQINKKLALGGDNNGETRMEL